MSTENVFDPNTNQTTTTTNNDAPISDNAFADRLKAIVDETGRPKYDSVEKALEALPASQEHIKRLEAERAADRAAIQELRDKAAQADALEEIVKRLQQNNPTVEKPTPSNAGMSEDAIVKQLENIIAQREARSTAESNVKLVSDTLVSKFGDLDKAKTAIAEKAKELGMSTQELAALSSKSPRAVLVYFGVTETKPIVNNPVVSSQNTQLNPSNGIEALKRPEKSLLLGATSKDQKEFMAKVKEEVYREHGITT